MPATQTITSFYTFTPSTVIRSAEVNNNFSNMRGHFIPMDPTASSGSPSMTYDLGGVNNLWRGGFLQYGMFYANTAGSVPTPATTTVIAVYARDDGKIYKKVGALETEIGAGGGVLIPVGTYAAPNTITAGGGISFSPTTGSRQLIFVQGDNTVTATDVTANPQIAYGNTAGLEIFLMGTDNSKIVYLENGNGLYLDAPWNSYDKSVLHLISLGNNLGWFEAGRKGP